MTGFTPEVRDALRAGAVASAEVLGPLIRDEFPWAHSAIDVGCGEGWLVAELTRLGMDAVGVDLEAATLGHSQPGTFESHDLEQPLNIGRTFDLAISLEVAEHLDPDRAESFVADLCWLAPVVVFSAAIPGQGGVHHVNEQWPRYWAELFGIHGWVVSGYLRRGLWNDNRVEPWYRQNLLVATTPGNVDRCSPGRFVTDSPPMGMVHPRLWNYIRFGDADGPT